MDSEIKVDYRVNSGIFVPDDTSICEYLCYLDILSIVKYVKEHHYSDKVWHYRYDPELMVKLAIIKCFRRLSYEKTILSTSIFFISFILPSSISRIPLRSPS